MVDPLEDTVDLHVTEYFSRTLFHHQAVPSHLSIGAASDVGKVRKENQDHYAVIRRQRSQEIVLSDLPIDEFEGRKTLHICCWLPTVSGDRVLVNWPAA